MRVGILTFHVAQNYGALLQAFALQKYLILQGYDAEIIDYKQQELIRIWSLFSKDRLKGRRIGGTIKRILIEFGWIFWFRWKRYRAFVQFQKKILKVSSISVLSDTAHLPSYDVYIIGSDQVWNYKLTGGYDLFYLGLFDKGDSKILFYAASTFPFAITDEAQALFKHSFANADKISVREEVLLKIYQPLTDKRIHVVVDPTLLLDVKMYDEIAADVKEKDYLLIYEVAHHSQTYAFAERLANENGWKIIVITSNVCAKFSSYIKQSATPQEFLGYIKNAKCVITTSFHGTALSIKYQVPFYTFLFGTVNDSRSINICNMYKLSDRLISNQVGVHFSKIEYERIPKCDLSNSYDFLQLDDK